mmetsp:Transcript_25149/g.45795  ORF Transcript_25149/g.45795 Transcript_25149/m.45795 type:complete len:210 (+) Transcript_25149:51-680(+)
MLSGMRSKSKISARKLPWLPPSRRTSQPQSALTVSVAPILVLHAVPQAGRHAPQAAAQSPAAALLAAPELRTRAAGAHQQQHGVEIPLSGSAAWVPPSAPRMRSCSRRQYLQPRSRLHGRCGASLFCFSSNALWTGKVLTCLQSHAGHPLPQAPGRQRRTLASHAASRHASSASTSAIQAYASDSSHGPLDSSRPRESCETALVPNTCY